MMCLFRIHPGLLVVFCTFLVLFCAAGCKQVYSPPALQTNPNLLVIEGVINTVTGASSTFHLSRTLKIADSLGFHTPELQAQVNILSNTGDSYILREQGNGIYTTPNLFLDPDKKYQLKIVTHNGGQYLSDPVPVAAGPPVDSLTWQQDLHSGDVTVNVNAHDPGGNSHYYRWYFSETWEYQAELIAGLVIENGLMVFADSTNQISTCWRSDSSTDILLGNSTALSQDRISQAPLTRIRRGAEKISVRYSLLASQYVLTPQAYQYWLILQRNSQNLGSLFDPQPTQFTGNYHNLTNPNEPVIGYLSAGKIQQQRLFIQHYQVNNWDTSGNSCPLRNIPQNSFNFQIYSYSDPSFAPYYFTTFPVGIEISTKACLDCRLEGGTTQKPDFW